MNNADINITKLDDNLVDSEGVVTEMKAVFYLTKKDMEEALEANALMVLGKYYDVPTAMLNDCINQGIEGCVELILKEI